MTIADRPVTLYDTTLRDGTQGENITLSLADKLRIAWLNEDDTSTKFLTLLLRVHAALRKTYPAEFAEADLSPAYGQPEDVATAVVARILTGKLAGRTLLVIVENLNRLFDDLKDEGQKRWRAFLQEQRGTATLATSDVGRKAAIKLTAVVPNPTNPATRAARPAPSVFTSARNR